MYISIDPGREDRAEKAAGAREKEVKDEDYKRGLMTSNTHQYNYSIQTAGFCLRFRQWERWSSCSRMSYR